MTDSVQQLAPWWFSGIIGLAGVVAGLLIKWLIDAVTSKSARAREDKLRFIQDKRVAYAELLAACTEVADVHHQDRLLVKRNREFDTEEPSAEEIEEHNREADQIDDRRTRAFSKLNSALAVVDLIAPAPVVEAANVLVSRSHHPHLLPRRLQAEEAYVDAVRLDLGYGPTSHLPTRPYEDLIRFDDPDSGV